MKRPCWTQNCYEKTFIGLKRSMKRLLLDPWKDIAGPKSVKKSLLLDPSVLWKEFCWTHEKAMEDPKSVMKSLLLDSNLLWRDFCLTHEETMLDPKALWKDFHWTQTCYKKSFAWLMKRPWWTQRRYDKTLIGLKRAIKRILLDPWKDHAGH